MKEGTIVIHIGYHKSASTYLQRRIFPRLSANFAFLPGYKTHAFGMLISENFEKDDFLQWLHCEIEMRYKQHRHALTILSQEALSGSPHGGAEPNPFVIANNLKQAFPRAKILIIIRNQFDYLLSIYTFRVAIKGYESRGLAKFLKEEGRKGLFEKLEYDRLIEHYLSLFGQENILVLPVELLKTSPELFHGKLATFLRIPEIRFKRNKMVNTSTKLACVVQMWRPVNLLFGYLLKCLHLFHVKTHETFPYQKLRFTFYRFKENTTKRLNRKFNSCRKLPFPADLLYGELFTRYAESNARLQRLLNFELKDLGYPFL